MPENFYLLCLVIATAVITLIATVKSLDRWLVRISNPDKLPPPLRVRRIKKQYVAPVARGRRVYPEQHKEMI